MFFIVTANGATGPVSITCETPAEAFEAAVGLMETRGTRDVLIDAGGAQYAPLEFRLRFLSSGSEPVSIEAPETRS